MVAKTAGRLTAAAFEPFGSVFEIERDDEDFPGEYVQRIAHFERVRANGRPELLFVRADARPLPLRVSQLERHPFTAQAFVPLDAGSYLVLAAPASLSSVPEIARAHAFIASNRQIVTYAPGIWHYRVTCIERSMRFAVFMWREQEVDTEVVDVEELLIDRAR